MSDAINPYRRYAGYQKAVRAIINAANAKDGLPPTTRTVERLTSEEMRHLRLAFWNNHVDDLGAGRARLHVRRIIRDLYAGDAERALDAWSAATNYDRRSLKRERTQAFERLLAAIAPWNGKAADHVREMLAARKGWASRLLENEGHDAAERTVQAFLAAAAHLPCVAPTPLRSFSAQHLQDSKALDPGTRLYRILADYLDAEEDEEEDLAARRRAALESANLVESFGSSVAYVAGPLRLVEAGNTHDFVLANALAGRASILTYEQVRSYTLHLPHGTTVLTVENETPFHALVQARPAQTLLVCSRGQPSAAVRALLAKLRADAGSFLHWGDIDGGGFRILRSIQSVVLATPLLMDEGTLLRYAARLTPMTEEKADVIERAAAGMPEHAATLRACLARGGWLEQESVSLSEVSLKLSQDHGI